MTPETKLYVQLAPDHAGRRQLQELQQALTADDRARLIPAAKFHLTVLHIGKLQRLIDSIQQSVDISALEILRRAKTFADELRALVAQVAGNDFHLHYHGTQQFGEHRDVLVCQFYPTPELCQLHHLSLDLLHNFLIEIGIQDTKYFIEQDFSLRNSLNLNPHVTLAKKSASKNRSLPPLVMRFTTMDVVYPSGPT
jgi:2'-5' RNA ligase